MVSQAKELRGWWIKMVNVVTRSILSLVSERTRTAAIDERIEEISSETAARYARGSVLCQEGSFLTEDMMDSRRATIRARMTS